MTKKRVLITGGAGFIGSHISSYLIEKNYSVIAVDNLITGTVKNIEHLLGNKDFDFLKQDVSKYIDIKGKLDYVHRLSPFSYPDIKGGIAGDP